MKQPDAWSTEPSTELDPSAAPLSDPGTPTTGPEPEPAPPLEPDLGPGSERAPIGPVAYALLGLASLVSLVGIVTAFLVLAIFLGGGTALTVVLLFVGIVPALFVSGRISAYRRRRSGVDRALAAQEAWAASLGLERITDRGVTLPVAAPPFDLAGRHTALHGWTGRYAGQSVAVLHYLVDTGTSDHPERRVYTAVAATGNADLPTTELVPQRGVAAVAARVGQDLAVESEEFNRAWRVTAVDERAAHALLTPRVIERLVRAARDAVRTVWSGPVIVTVDRGSVRDTGTLARRLDLVTDLASLVPGFARSDGARSGAPATAGSRAHLVARQRRSRSNTEMVLLLLAVAGLWGGSRLFHLGPFVAWSAMILGLVLGLGSTRIAAWIDRRRQRRR